METSAQKKDSLQALVAKHKALAKEKPSLDEDSKHSDKQEPTTIMSDSTFEELGVCVELCDALK